MQVSTIIRDGRDQILGTVEVKTVDNHVVLTVDNLSGKSIDMVMDSDEAEAVALNIQLARKQSKVGAR